MMFVLYIPQSLKVQYVQYSTSTRMSFEDVMFKMNDDCQGVYKADILELYTGISAGIYRYRYIVVLQYCNRYSYCNTYGTCTGTGISITHTRT